MESMSKTLEMKLKRSIKTLQLQLPQILHLDDIMGSDLPGRLPKRAVHLPTIDWTVPDHGNITHELLN